VTRRQPLRATWSARQARARRGRTCGRAGRPWARERGAAAVGCCSGRARHQSGQPTHGTAPWSGMSPRPAPPLRVEDAAFIFLFVVGAVCARRTRQSTLHVLVAACSCCSCSETVKRNGASRRAMPILVGIFRYDRFTVETQESK
jgi:hypothetical protein